MLIPQSSIFICNNVLDLLHFSDFKIMEAVALTDSQLKKFKAVFTRYQFYIFFQDLTFFALFFIYQCHQVFTKTRPIDNPYL